MTENELKDKMYQKLSLYSSELEDRIEDLEKLNTTITMENERLTLSYEDALEDLEKKENIIKEVREYIENHFLYHYGSDKKPIVFEDNYIQEIVDILDKEGNMKVIDLLNKIANGEVRHDIKINTRNYYCSIEEYLKKFGINEDTLNVEVIGFDDIIEEDKKIEKLDTWFSLEKDCENDNIQYANHNFRTYYDKINEIIDKLNEGE